MDRNQVARATEAFELFLICHSHCLSSVATFAEPSRAIRIQ